MVARVRRICAAGEGEALTVEPASLHRDPGARAEGSGTRHANHVAIEVEREIAVDRRGIVVLREHGRREGEGRSARVQLRLRDRGVARGDLV